VYSNGFLNESKTYVIIHCTKLFGSVSQILDSENKKNLKIQKGVIRIRISKKNRQHNGQKKKYKRTNNDLQDIHIKLKIE
jgi:hypothetical protein